MVCWLFFVPVLLWLLGLTLLIAKSTTELKYVLERCRVRGGCEAFGLENPKPSVPNSSYYSSKPVLLVVFNLFSKRVMNRNVSRGENSNLQMKASSLLQKVSAEGLVQDWLEPNCTVPTHPA